ncbi:hypothetical protein F5879DRAFT_928066 [Lentinula edodes]|nr:hypothetical protein F5879DRAFT_928066 [Lentinula edodes]
MLNPFGTPPLDGTDGGKLSDYLNHLNILRILAILIDEEEYGGNTEKSCGILITHTVASTRCWLGRRTISAPRAVRFADPSTQNGTSVLQGDGNRLDPTDNQISKPPGVMGKPGQGGYSLRMELDWTNDQFESVEVWIFIQFIIPSLRSYPSQKYIGETVEGVLDVTQSFDEQSLMNIKQIQQMAVHKYPFLNVYRKHWVVNDFIKCHLNSLKNKTQTEPTARLPGDYRVIQTRGRSRRSINTEPVGALND